MAKRKGKKRVTKKARTDSSVESRKKLRKNKVKKKTRKRQRKKKVSKPSRKKTGARAKDPRRVAAAKLGHKRKLEREAFERRSRAAKLGHKRKLEREEKERRAAAARLGWQRRWEREGRKPKPVRKGAPAIQPRKPRKVKTKVRPKPKPKPAPRGTPEGERQIMMERLETAKASLPDSTILGPVINADDTVDSELLVYIPKGKSVRDLSLDIEEVLRPPRGQWFNVGIRVPPNKAIASPEDYERALGLIQIQMHSRRSRYAGPAWDDWRQEVLPKIEKGTKGWRKPEQLFVRLYWSPIDERPDY
jgi:hypothetical protein